MANTSFTMDSTNNLIKQDDDEDLPFIDDDHDDDIDKVLEEESDSHQELSTKFNTEDTLNIDTLQKGIPDKFYILSHASVPNGGFSM